MSNPLRDYLGVHAVAMPLREQRMQLIASNLGNADTPGYQARDINFQAVLEKTAQRSAPLRTTQARHMDGLPAAPQIYQRNTAQPSLDGNNVDADAERAAYARAALEYRASLNFVESKVRTLLTAITGQ